MNIDHDLIYVIRNAKRDAQENTLAGSPPATPPQKRANAPTNVASQLHHRRRHHRPEAKRVM